MTEEDKKRALESLRVVCKALGDAIEDIQKTAKCNLAEWLCEDLREQVAETLSAAEAMAGRVPVVSSSPATAHLLGFDLDGVIDRSIEDFQRTYARVQEE